MATKNLTWLALGTAAAAIYCATAAVGPSATEVDAETAVSMDAWWPEGAEVTMLVDMADNLNDRQRDELLADLPAGFELNSIYADDEGLYRLTLPAADAHALMDRFASDPRVEFVEPEAVYSTPAPPSMPGSAAVTPMDEAPSGSPDDPLYQFQWNFEQIGAVEAWDATRGNRIVVAVIDTGVAYANSSDGRFTIVRDLANTEMVGGYDFVDDDDQPYDQHGHGTHVAGTVAQSTNNAYGVAGIAPGAAIMPLRVLDAGGRGTTADIADAIRFAADNGADIINMSLGGPLPSRVMADAVAYAHRNGVLVIAAAGNSGWSLPSFPAAYRNVVGVSATQFDRTRTFYSNYGSYIDIAAPGGNTRVDQNNDGRPDGILQETIAIGTPLDHEFGSYMGTSMASPHVAGVAALIMAQGIDNPDRVAEVLYGSATQDVPSYDTDSYGAGLLDANAATKYTLTHFQMPRLLFAALLLLLLLGFARRSGSPKEGPSTNAAFMGAGVGATGLSIIAAFFALVGAHTPDIVVAASMSPLAWPAALSGGCCLTSSAILWSAAPVLGLYALFGGAQRRWVRGLVVGLMVGMGAALVAESFAPLRDITGMPGVAGIVDQSWLFVNGLVALLIASVAARPRQDAGGGGERIAALLQ